MDNSVIGIDIGSSTVKIIEYNKNKILNKQIFTNNNVENDLKNFIEKNNINNFEKIVLTGIGADKLKLNQYNVPIEKVEEFEAIAKGGLELSQRKEAIIVSIGTGTALIRATENDIKHLGGTGIGAGTLINLCKKVTNIEEFNDILELSKSGNLENVDLRIGDITEKEITTLPKDLTLSNFGKLKSDASDADIILGILNMIFEVVGMMAAFSSINDTIKEVVLIGNIVSIPCVKDILSKIEKTHNLTFIIPDNAQFAVAFGAIKKSEK